MKPGIYDGISNADYHGGAGVSKSMLDVIRAKSPMHLHWRRENPQDHAPTPAQMIGTAAHSLILEPAEFVKEYTLALRKSDVPHAIADKDALVAMVNELNSTRLPKLPTTGTKAELVVRIQECGGELLQPIDAYSASDLKAEIARLNESRPGMLPASGTMDELAAILRANGREITLWSDVKQEWMANNGHRNVLEPEQWDQLHAMRDAVMAHPAAAALLTGGPGKAEQSVYWTDEETGVLCRCRPDFWRQRDGLVVDLKTTENAGADEFGRSTLNWRYHVQDAFYTNGINAAIQQSNSDLPQVRAFIFIAVEKSAPHAVGVYVLDADSKKLGQAECAHDLQFYAECQQHNFWPGYGDKIQNLTLPAWHLARNATLIGA